MWPRSVTVTPIPSRFNPFDAGYPRAERREEAGVLGADDAAAHDGHGRRDAVEVENPVAVHDVRVGHADASRRDRRRAGRDQKEVRREASCHPFFRVEHGDGVRIFEARGTGDKLYAVPLQVAVDLLRLQLRDLPQAPDELPQALLAVEPDAHPVELAAPESGQVEGGFPQSLRREGSGVHARAADLRGALDQGDLPSEVRRLRGPLLASG